MPQLGETVAEGKITTWFKAVGDTVKPGDNLFEVETDKVTVEVPVTSGGIISDIRISAGDIAKVGEVVAVISEAGAPLVERTLSVKAPAAPAAPAAPVAQQAAARVAPAPQPVPAGTRDPFN